MVMVLQNTKEKEKSLKAGSEKRQITYKKKKKKKTIRLTANFSIAILEAKRQ